MGITLYFRTLTFLVTTLNRNAVKIEPITTPTIVNLNKITPQSNGISSTNCRNCIDYRRELQKLQGELQRQERLTEHWKAIAQTYEPECEDPKWLFDGHAERIAAESLDMPTISSSKKTTPQTEKPFKRNSPRKIKSPCVITRVKFD